MYYLLTVNLLTHPTKGLQLNLTELINVTGYPSAFVTDVPILTHSTLPLASAPLRA